MSSSWFMAASGGALIGAASAVLFLANGRVAGISGIVGGTLQRVPDVGWRVAFVVGLALAGVFSVIVSPQAIGPSLRSPLMLIIAGLLVGFGTRLGSGCTSGHGVCGLARSSPRSLVAVAAFMTTGVITAMVAGRFL